MAVGIQSCCRTTRTFRTSSPSSAWTSCPRIVKIVNRARGRSSSSASAHVAEQFTGLPGKHVKQDTIRSFAAILDGECDEIRAVLPHEGLHRRRVRCVRRDEEGLVMAGFMCDIVTPVAKLVSMRSSSSSCPASKARWAF